MVKKIRRRIISETRAVAVLIDSNAEPELWCELCGDRSALITPLTAAKLLRIGTREVYRLIESGKVHFIELPDSRMFVCAVSLSRCV